MLLAMKILTSVRSFVLILACGATGAVHAQTSTVNIVSLTPATVAPNGALSVQMQITNTGYSAWDPISTFSCGRFFDFLGIPNEYNLLCHPFPEESGTYGIRLEAHPLDAPDWVNFYYITDLAFPHPIAPGETINLTEVVTASLPPGRYRLVLITQRHFYYAFTSRVLNSPADALALGATADFVVASDVTPPSISTTGLLAGTCSLEPPNGQMIPVGTIAASDSQNAVASLRVEVTSTDPTMEAASDVVVEGGPAGPLAVQLRAKRAGFAGDRVYRLAITATDSVGNAAVVRSQCTVPHNQGQQ